MEITVLSVRIMRICARIGKISPLVRWRNYADRKNN